MFTGCKLSKVDLRDYKLASSALEGEYLPEEYSCPLKTDVKQQGIVGSCVAHAASSILEYHSPCKVELSTNFIYGIQHSLFGREHKGMYMRDACDIVTKYGDMLESDCPGNSEVPICFTRAENAAADESKMETAYKYRMAEYFLCNNNQEIKHALYNHGPVLIALKWYNNFHVNKDGVLVGKLSGKHSYHAVFIYGYSKEGFLCQNSWGRLWGNGGRFILPYDIPIREARGFIDVENDEELIRPNNDKNKLKNFFYKIANFILQLFQKK